MAVTTETDRWGWGEQMAALKGEGKRDGHFERELARVIYMIYRLAFALHLHVSRQLFNVNICIPAVMTPLKVGAER